MRIVTFRAGPWPKLAGWRRTVMRLLTLVIPKANPDFEELYDRVILWWLEIDSDGTVSREVGFDETRTPLVAAPLGQNVGIFTDLDAAPAPLGDAVDSLAFEHAWADVADRWRASQGIGTLPGAA